MSFLNRSRCSAWGRAALAAMVINLISLDPIPTVRSFQAFRSPTPPRAWAQVVPLGYRDAVEKLAAANNGYIFDSDTARNAAEGAWTVLGYYHQISDGLYASPKYKLLRTLVQLAEDVPPPGGAPIYRLVRDPGKSGVRPYRDGSAMFTPGQAVDNDSFPAGVIDPDLLHLPAPAGLPPLLFPPIGENIPDPIAWATTPPLYEECKKKKDTDHDYEPPPDYHLYGGVTVPCYRYEEVGVERMAAREPGDEADPLDPNPQGPNKQPYVKWQLSTQTTPRWLDTGRSIATNSFEQAPPPKSPNDNYNQTCQSADSKEVPCYRWTLRGSFDNGTNNANDQVLSRSNVIAAPDPNNPFVLYTVRGFFYDETLKQLVEFEQRGIPSMKGDPSRADTSLLFVTSIKELLERRNDLGTEAQLSKIYKDGFPQPMLKRVNLGGLGQAAADGSLQTPPPYGAPVNDIIAWSRRNQGPITTKFEVRVNSNMATVKLGVARPNKRHSPVATVDSAGNPVTIGSIDPDITRGTGAGDISVEDTTSFAIKGP